MGLLKKRPAILVQDGKAKAIEDWVADEYSYDLYINDTLLDTIVVSPSDLEAHALGFVVTEGFVDSKEVKGVERRGDTVIVKIICAFF